MSLRRAASDQLNSLAFCCSNSASVSTPWALSWASLDSSSAELAAPEDVEDHLEQQQQPCHPDEEPQDRPEQAEQGVVVGNHGDLPPRGAGPSVPQRADSAGDA